MASYKSFAITGFGDVGSRILDEFLKSESSDGHKVRVLTRSRNKPELAPYISKGVNVIAVDYSSLESLTPALEGVDVVLSTLRDDGLEIQKNVIRAAKTAGVKLFVPSEYGKNTLDETSEYLTVKRESQDLLKELGLPYTLFFTGIFIEMLFALGNHVGLDFNAGKFTLFGDGNVPMSWTSPRSIGPFVHHVLTTIPANQLENRVFNIEGDRKTLREIIALWETKHGRQAQIITTTDEEVEKYKAEHDDVLLRFLSDAWRDGRMLVGGDDNGVWPEWNPLTWEDLIV